MAQVLGDLYSWISATIKLALKPLDERVGRLKDDIRQIQKDFGLEPVCAGLFNETLVRRVEDI